MKWALLLVLVACASAPREPAVYVPMPVATESPRYGCSKACALVPRAASDDVSQAELDRLFREVAQTPVGSDSAALDALFFHDEEVRHRLARPTATPLGPAWEAVLRTELERRAVWFALRVVDEAGTVRAELPDTLIGLGEKKHVEITRTDRLQPFNTNGTWVRVGRRHVWYRA